MEQEFPRSVTCCFSGHRPSKLPWRGNESDPRCVLLKEKLRDVTEALYEAGIRHFLCGMAVGCDTYFCEAVLALRKSRRDVTLEAAVPCRTQADRWDEPARRRYEGLLERCDRVTVLQDEYTRGCMQRRNRYMLARSSVLVAVYDGSAGGTRNTVAQAEKMGLEAVLLQP